MQRNCQINRLALLLQTLDARNDAAGGKRHIAVAHVAGVLAVQKIQRLQNAVKVQHRLTAAHNYHSAHHRALLTQALVEQINLSHDFCCRQVAYSALQAAGAEGAVHIAADLAGNAHAVAVIMVHQNSFYRIAIRQAQKQLARHAVGGILLTQKFQTARQHGKFFLQHGNIGLAQVVHRGKIKDRLLVQPLKHLLGTELFQTCRHK